MANRATTRWSHMRRDPWLLPLALFGLLCLTPFTAQFFGWWHPDTTQREATSSLNSAVSPLLFGCVALFGSRRWRGRATIGHGLMMFIAGLAVAEGIIGVSTGFGVLLGVLAAIPTGFLVLQSLITILFIAVWVARLGAGPERLVL